MIYLDLTKFVAKGVTYQVFLVIFFVFFCFFVFDQMQNDKAKL